MNDDEYAVPMRREQNARASGYFRNDYTCAVCGLTFLDWPTRYDTYSNRAYCDSHATFRPVGADIVPVQSHEQVKN